VTYRQHEKTKSRLKPFSAAIMVEARPFTAPGSIPGASTEIAAGTRFSRDFHFPCAAYVP
jgi:hypothetical protein